jgi:hypothetical protein
MLNIRELARSKTFPVLFLLAVATLFIPSIAHAQIQYTPSCASAIMDPYGEIENTVCISGDSSNLDSYQEVDNNTDGSGLQWYTYVNANSSIYGDGSVVCLNCDVQAVFPYGNAIEEFSWAPTLGYYYYLDGDVQACFDETNGDDPYYWLC